MPVAESETVSEPPVAEADTLSEPPVAEAETISEPEVPEWGLASRRYLYERFFDRSFIGDDRGANQGPPTRILIVAHDASRSGAPLIALRLARALGSLERVECFILLGEHGPLLRDFEECGHVAVIGDRDFVRNRSEDSLTRLQKEISGFLEQFGDNPPIAAICNSLESAVLGICLARAGLPPITLVHEIANFYPRDLVAQILRASKHVVYPARIIEQVAAEWIGEPLHRGEILPQGLLDDHFGAYPTESARCQVLKELDLPDDTTIVLGCGTADWRKGLDTFVAVARQVLERWDKPLKFVWVGKGELTHHSALFWAERELRRYGLEEQVLFIGEREFVEPYFVAADVFLLTSRDDPFPCVVHEAMAAECAVIAFEGAGGIPEILRDGCGSVVPSGDVEAMSRQLESLLSDSEERTAICRRARRRVREKLRFGAYASSIAELAGLPALRSDPKKPVYFLFSAWSGGHRERMTSYLIEALRDRGFEALALFVRGRFGQYQNGGPATGLARRYLQPDDGSEASVRLALERFLARSDPGVLIPMDSEAIELTRERKLGPRFRIVGWVNNDPNPSAYQFIGHGASWDRIVVPNALLARELGAQDYYQRSLGTIIEPGVGTKGEIDRDHSNGSLPALVSTVCLDRWQDCLEYVHLADRLEADGFQGQLTLMSEGSKYPAFRSQLRRHLEAGWVQLLHEPTDEVSRDVFEASDYAVVLENSAQTRYTLLEAMERGCIPIVSQRVAAALETGDNGQEIVVLEPGEEGGGMLAELRRLGDDLPRRAELARAAREEAVASGEKMSSAWARLLDSCFEELDGVFGKRQTEVEVRRGLTISIPASKSVLPSRFLFALPKSGSTLLNNIFVRICQEIGVHHLPVHDLLFEKGIAYDAGLCLRSMFVDTGYCYGVFRWLPTYLDPDLLSRSRKVLLVRDPRDMMVSEYFSLLYSHPAPGGRVEAFESARRLATGGGIDDYAVGPGAEASLSRFEDYRRMLDHGETRVYRYEEVIYDKVNWVADMLDFFGWSLSNDLVESIVAEHDVIPEREDPYAHIRQAHPGNHTQKLRPETVRTLDRLFGDAVSPFGIRLGPG